MNFNSGLTEPQPTRMGNLESALPCHNVPHLSEVSTAVSMPQLWAVSGRV